MIKLFKKKISIILIFIIMITLFSQTCLAAQTIPLSRDIRYDTND